MPPLIAAALIVLFEALCFTTALPVLSYFTQQLGGNGAWVGLMFGLMTGPKILSNPLWGALSDRIGRRPVLILNTLGTMSASILWAIAPGVGVLALSRGLVGVFGGQAILAQAIAADSSTPEKRSAAMGVLGSAFAVALGFGPLLGGWVAGTFGYGAVGWVCAGLQLASLSVISAVLRETRGRDDARRGATSVAVRVSWSQQPVLGLLLVTLALTIGFSHLTSTLGIVAERAYGYGVQQTGYVFAAFGVVAALIQGGAVRGLVGRVGEKLLSVWGFVALLGGFVVLSWQTSEGMLWTGVLFIGVGSALSTPCLTGLLSRATPEHQQGGMLGINQGVTSLGRMIGAMAGGWLIEHAWGASRSAYGSAALFVAIALAILLAVRVDEAAPAATGVGVDVDPV